MRVVIAEDMLLLREGIARVLASGGIELVAQVGDARALVAAVVEHRPNLAIVDVRMPPTFVDEGARAVALLRARMPDLAVLVLSNVVDPRLAATLITERPRGFGYLLKERVLDVEEFLAAVRRVAAGGTVVDESVVTYYLRHNEGRLRALTPRELDVLERLANGLSNAAIGEALVVSERTVDAHVRSIFTKLDLPEAPDVNRRVRATLLWLDRTLASRPAHSGAGTDAAGSATS